MRAVVSAPGKLILAGEYAVLSNGLAVVAAVARRARAWVAVGAAREASVFVDAAAVVLLAERFEDAALAVPDIVVDSAELRDVGGIKLGLGSSAAVTVAVIGCALAHAGHPLDRALVHRLARAAHAMGQGGRGSGADVAAASFGGTVGFRAGVATPLSLPALTWQPLWTGVAADTVSLVDRVTAARGAVAVETALGAIATAAEELAAARVPAAALDAIRAGGDAIAALSAAVGVDLETAQVRAARAVARRAGGEVKTCGAGGGDVALAAFLPGVDVRGLAPAFVEAGCTPLDLAVDPRGVDFG